jgi:putative transposase
MSVTQTQKPYPTDLEDAEWEQLAPFIPPAKTGGRRRKHSMRVILNAIFYLLRSGGAWRLLPHDFPPWQTVYHYFRQWCQDGTWEQMNTVLRTKLRQRDGREAQPSAGAMDTQSVKTTETRGVRGFDAGKKVKGRKRHLLVDTLGLLLRVLVHGAHIQDRDGAKLLLAQARPHFPRLHLIWADGIYGGPLIGWVWWICGWVLQIVPKPPNQRGFQVLPRRWVVERTFAWLGRYRRMSKDYEGLTSTSEGMIYAVMVHLMVRRFVRQIQLVEG